MITLQLTGTEQVRATFARLSDIMQRQAIAATAVKVENYVEGEAAKHNKTGALVGSLKKARLSDGSWQVYHDPRIAHYAKYVHDGTRAHEIRPKNKRALRYAKDGVFWYWFGPQSPQQKVLIRKWVKEKAGGTASTRIMFRWPKHPGSKPDPWFQRAAAMAPAIFRAEVEKRIAKL